MRDWWTLAAGGFLGGVLLRPRWFWRGFYYQSLIPQQGAGSGCVIKLPAVWWLP